MAFIDPFAAAGSRPVVSQAAQAGQNAAQAMVQPRAAAIGRRAAGLDAFTRTYQGNFHGIPLIGMAAGIHRGSQTILRQGFNENIDIRRGFGVYGTSVDEAGKYVKGKALREMRADPLRAMYGWGKRESYGARAMVTKFPRSFNRFDSTSIYDVEHDILNWNPWQFSTGFGNPVMKHMPGMDGRMAFQPGTMAQLSAAATMHLGGDTVLSESMAQGVRSTISHANAAYSTQLGVGEYGPPALEMTGANASYALLGANQGVLTGRVAGLYAGAKAGLAGGSVPEEVLSASRAAAGGTSIFASTAESAASIGQRVRSAGGVINYARPAFADEGVAAGMGALGKGAAVKGAAGLGDALPLIGGLATGMQAITVGRMLGKLVSKPISAGIDLASDSIKSFKGSIGKPVFGMGFHDSDITITARRRGVQAIQNSRLNARSFLGAEAAAMWGHFG